MAFDKRTGETVWTSAPGARPYDTTYAAPIIANVDGTRLLIQGGERRLGARRQAADGRAGLEDTRSRSAASTRASSCAARRHHHAQRGEPRLERDGDDGRARRLDEGRAEDGAAQVEGLRLAGRLLLARARRRPALSGGQRREPRRLRRDHGQAALAPEPRHDSEGFARAGRRQALRRDGERQVLHHRAVGDGREDSRRRPARHRAAARVHHRLGRRLATAASSSSPTRRSTASARRRAPAADRSSGDVRSPDTLDHGASRTCRSSRPR